MKKIPLFQPFEDIKQGMDALIVEIQKVKDNDARLKLAVIYGCLGQTLEEQMK